MKAKRDAARRRVHEQQAKPSPAADSGRELAWPEVQAILDEEIQRLPEKYRTAFVLCCLESRGRAEAARALGLKEGTLSSRLDHARKLLRQRLARRGVALSAVLAAAALTDQAGRAAVPAMLVDATAKAATLFAEGKALASGSVSAKVVALASSGLKGMAVAKLKLATALLMTLCVAAAGAGMLAHQALVPNRPDAKPEGQSKLATKGPDQAKPATGNQTRADRYGDPLPAGAIARLGTLRFHHGAEIGQIAFSPDSKLLASVGNDGNLILWEPSTGKVVRRIPGAVGGGKAGVAFSADGDSVWTAEGSEIRQWPITTGRELPPFKGTPPFKVKVYVGQLWPSPDGRTLACVGRSQPQNQNTIVFLDATTGKELHHNAGLTNYVEPSLAFSADSKTWALANRKDNELGIYDTHTGKLIRQLVGHATAARTVAFSPDGKVVASADAEGTLHFWDAVTGGRLQDTGGLRAYHNLTYSPDGKLLAAGGSGHTPELWDVAAKKPLPPWDKQRNQVGAVLFSPDGKMLASASNSCIYIWDVATGKAVLPFQGHDRQIDAVAFGPDGKSLVSAAGDFGTVRRWEVQTGKELPNLGAVRDFVYALAYSSDGRVVAVGTGNHDGTVWLLDAETGKEIRKLVIPGGYVTCLAFSADGKTLASRGNNGPIHVWDAVTGKEIRHFQANGYSKIAISADGRLVAEADGHDTFVRLWETATGKLVRELPGHGRSSYAVAFSPDGKLLASAGADDRLRIWEVATGKEVQQIKCPSYSDFVTFGPDGRTLLSGGNDNSAHLWEIATGGERLQFRAHERRVLVGAFSRDGKLVATGSADTTVLIWDLTGRLTRESQPLTRSDLESCWADLAGADAAKAYLAICRLAAAPPKSVPFMQEHLKPVAAVNQERIARLVADLDSKQFLVRQKANQELEKLADLAEAALRKALSAKPTLEVRRRLEALLQKLAGPASSPERLQTLRAVEVLEHIGTPEARQLLQSLAKGAPEAQLTREAQASLSRFIKREGQQP